MNNLRAFEIVDFLKEKKYASFTELMARFKISQATIHRDIDALAEMGKVRKVHGGAAFADPASDPGKMTVLSPTFQERVNVNRTRKRAISERAFQKIEDGDILFLDSSTTVFFLAERLLESAFSSLTLLTNSAMIIQNFRNFPKHYVLLAVGGSFDHQLNAFLGGTALAQMESISITKAFVSAFGFSDGTVTTNHENHAEFLRAVLKSSKQSFLLADSTKKNRSGLFRFGTQSQFDEILTEKSN